MFWLFKYLWSTSHVFCYYKYNQKLMSAMKGSVKLQYHLLSNHTFKIWSKGWVYDKCSEVDGQLLMSNEPMQNSQATVLSRIWDSLFSTDEIAIKRTNAQISEMEMSKTQVIQAKKNSRRKLECKAVSNPAPGNKLIIMHLFH